MAGGVGSRFWPMSTQECPKQFIDVLGVGKSLLQLTMDRFKDIATENVWIVTNKKYFDKCHEQLPEVLCCYWCCLNYFSTVVVTVAICIRVAAHRLS